MALNSDAIDVVVMASGVNRIPLYEGCSPGYKALINLHGRACIHYVLDALQGVKAVRRICIEGPQTLLKEALAGRQPQEAYEFEEGGETLLDSLMIGLKHFASEPAVLFVTADLPLITPEAVQDFLLASAETPVDYDHNLYLSAVASRSYTGPYTRFTKPFNHYRDISLCHGNLFIADPWFLHNPAATKQVNRLYRSRKSAITSALALGWKIALIYLVGVELLHLLTLRQMAAFASRHFGFGIVPVILDHPEITLDVDEPQDYAFVRELLDRSPEWLPHAS